MAKKSYGAAAKEYFASRGEKFSLPKKDSEHYKAIRALMASGDVTGDSAVSAAAAPLEKKVRKVSKKKEVDAKAPGPADKPIKPETTTLIDSEHLNKKVVDGVVEAAEKAPVKKRKPRAVQSDGLSPQQNLEKKLTEENAHIQVVPADFPGLKDQIAKVLDVKPEGVPEKPAKPAKPEMMKSKTTEGKKTVDPPAVQARAPFSFTAMRALLRN